MPYTMTNNMDASPPPAHERSAKSTANIPKTRTGKPIVLILSLDESAVVETLHSQLYSGLRRNATMHEAHTAGEAFCMLRTSPPPDAVVVTDSEIVRYKHRRLVRRMVSYTRAGGRVVLGCLFSLDLQENSVRKFFAHWDLPWGARARHRSMRIALNIESIPAALDSQVLYPEYSMDGMPLRNIAREAAVYLPIHDSDNATPGPASSRTGLQVTESPAVLAHIGKGYVGYVGDVRGEQQSSCLLLEMCGVRVKPGHMGARMLFTGSTEFLDGIVQPRYAQITEMPLPGCEGMSIERPRESEVIVRVEKRAIAAAKQLAIAEGLKQEGNELFKNGEWVNAAKKYHAAAFAYGPRPVYMTNLAAAFLKLEVWAEAESAADRALRYEPSNIKARFRQAVARKASKNYPDSIKDFYSVLRQDPDNNAGRSELTQALALNSVDVDSDDNDKDDIGEDSERHSEDNDAPSVILTESNAAEYTNFGQIYETPCPYYNHDSSMYRSICRFEHGPDLRSVRDLLGRNVCKMWLLNACYHQHGKCYYAHDTTYLRARGWWANEEQLAAMRAEVARIIDCATMDGRSMQDVEMHCSWAWSSWRYDVWATAELFDSVRDSIGAFLTRLHLFLVSEDLEERSGMRGLGSGFAEELLSQRVKPRDEDAWDVMRALRGL